MHLACKQHFTVVFGIIISNYNKIKMKSEIKYEYKLVYNELLLRFSSETSYICCLLQLSHLGNSSLTQYS